MHGSDRHLAMVRENAALLSWVLWRWGPPCETAGLRTAPAAAAWLGCARRLLQQIATPTHCDSIRRGFTVSPLWAPNNFALPRQLSIARRFRGPLRQEVEGPFVFAKTVGNEQQRCRRRAREDRVVQHNFTEEHEEEQRLGVVKALVNRQNVEEVLREIMLGG